MGTPAEHDAANRALREAWEVAYGTDALSETTRKTMFQYAQLIDRTLLSKDGARSLETSYALLAAVVLGTGQDDGDPADPLEVTCATAAGLLAHARRFSLFRLAALVWGRAHADGVSEVYEELSDLIP